jgi:hypothetical protein
MEICTPSNLTINMLAAIDALKTVDTNTLNVIINSMSNTVNNYITFQKNFFVGEVLNMAGDFVTEQIISNFMSGVLPTNFDLSKLINKDVPNGQFDQYGIGIGEMFMCVGL